MFRYKEEWLNFGTVAWMDEGGEVADKMIIVGMQPGDHWFGGGSGCYKAVPDRRFKACKS